MSALPDDGSKPMPSTPLPDGTDQERMYKYMTDRRVIGVRHVSFNVSLPSLTSDLSISPPQFDEPPPYFRNTPFNAQYDPLVQPALIRHEITSSSASQKTVSQARWAASRIIAGEDNRLLVIVGPCSIHNPEQAIAYAKMLKEDIPKWDGLLIVMRAYL